ncbi:MAG TPA: hypothetical protein VHU85_08390 [Acidimicrobiales bacterium]|jgi:hypothetical protein|nr:hypothetical protein [Acidimicrobiales bacterium]
MLEPKLHQIASELQAVQNRLSPGPVDDAATIDLRATVSAVARNVVELARVVDALAYKVN